MYLLFIIFFPILALTVLLMLCANLIEKAGHEKKDAYIPGKNIHILFQMTGKSAWWYLSLIIPIINFITFCTLTLDLAVAFGIQTRGKKALALLFGFFYLPYLNFKEKPEYIGPHGLKPGSKPPKKSATREWADAIIFAVIAATFIRIFALEAYTIPTSSMEGSLMVGDFLFVSKFHYGPRIPNTPLSVPFFHNTLPVFNSKSYVEWITLPYMRIEGHQDIKRNDIVVFNFPAGDTVSLEYNSAKPFYDLIREENGSRQAVFDKYHIVYRPVDKRDNYIKRCVAIPGDTLQIIDRMVYINGDEMPTPEHAQFAYNLKFNPGTIQTLDPKAYPSGHSNPVPEAVYKQLEDLGVTLNDYARVQDTAGNVWDIIYLEHGTLDQAIAALQGYNFVQSVTQQPSIEGKAQAGVFPNNRLYPWNTDFFGPLVIPKKGMTIALNDGNYALYQRAIKIYEGHTLQKKNGKYLLDGQEASEYTFEMDYYFMMGDNRHNSQDSRFWGYVPEDHIVGKAWFIWLSLDQYGTNIFNKMRFGRMFQGIKHGV